MSMPVTLSVYLGRQFFLAIAVAFAGLLTVMSLVDFVELLRRTSGHEAVPFAVVLEMIVLRLPYIGAKMLPFAVLVGSMLALTRLTRTSELVVARASGVSVWQFLQPALLLVLFIGFFFVTVLNPISAAMLSRYEQIEGKYITGRPSLLAVSSSGLWLRQLETSNPEIKEYIIHAQRVSQKDMRLSRVIVFIFGEKSKFIGRMDAQTAVLKEGYWEFRDVIISRLGEKPQTLPATSLATDLTLGQIQDSFASPMTLSFWQIPAFIGLLEAAGFSALRHKLYWHSMLASPLLLVAMVFLAALFSLRLPRRGGIAGLAVAGVVCGFALYFVTDLVNALGQSGSLPIILAAWSPAAMALMAGIGLLLHFEDG